MCFIKRKEKVLLTGKYYHDQQRKRKAENSYTVYIWRQYLKFKKNTVFLIILDNFWKSEKRNYPYCYLCCKAGAARNI
jgi:hypothetical protein